MIMKFVFMWGALAAVVSAESFYEEIEEVDTDELISNPVKFQSFINCYVDKGPCTPLTESHKELIKDSILRTCDRCSYSQRQRYAKFLWALRTSLPRDYILFRQKYDPTGLYFDKLESLLANYLQFNKPFYSSHIPYYYYLYKK